MDFGKIIQKQIDVFLIFLLMISPHRLEPTLPIRATFALHRLSMQSDCLAPCSL